MKSFILALSVAAGALWFTGSASADSRPSRGGYYNGQRGNVYRGGSNGGYYNRGYYPRSAYSYRPYGYNTYGYGYPYGYGYGSSFYQPGASINLNFGW